MVNKATNFALLSQRSRHSTSNICTSSAKRHPGKVIFFIVIAWVLMFSYVVYKAPESTSTLSMLSFVATTTTALTPSTATTASASAKLTPRSKIAFGTRGGGEKTADLVRDAILTGFRHIVTSANHQNHNETGVGVGWKMVVEKHPEKLVKRTDLFLQTMFVPWDGADFRKPTTDDPMMSSTKVPSSPTIAQQVTLTVEQSLRNLQTTYIDAILYHNFRAKLHPYEDMIQAWRVLEDYVQRGIIRYLGISNIHDENYFHRLYNESIIKPSIVQNRFHSNRGFDVSLRPMFQRYQVAIQRFWVLTGNGDGVKRNLELAKLKGVTPEQLMLAFIMSLGDTPLVGTHNMQHMKDDLQISRQYEEIFSSDSERAEFARNIGMTQ